MSPSRPPAPPRFWTQSRCALTALAFALPGVLLGLAGGACGMSDAAGTSGDGIASGGPEPSTSSTGVGGGSADATVPDAQPDVTPPDYAELCGEGACVPGPEDGCVSDDIEGRSGAHRDGVYRDLGTLGCHVVADDEGEPETACVPVGTGALDAPCQSVADCAPGTTCVPTETAEGQSAAGTCRPYCCDDVEACDPGSYCAPRTQIDDPDLDVPVCVAVTPCELLEDGTCPVGTTCSVVREDGTTSCVVPGSGTLCEPCPCAAGYVCAVHTGLCQRLCRTDGTGEECGGGFCQGGSSDYPAGIGVCVGGDDDACLER